MNLNLIKSETLPRLAWAVTAQKNNPCIDVHHGPWIETEFDPADAVVICHINGEMRQMASTRDMIFTVRQLIAFVSSVMTLEPGDLLLTGTPAGVSPLSPGDTVDVSVEGIGTLSNPVIAEYTH